MKTWRGKMLPSEKRHLDCVLGGSSNDVAIAIEKVQDFAVRRAAKTGQKSIEIFQKTVSTLVDLSKGKPGGGSWKDKLSEDATWVDIEREAN